LREHEFLVGRYSIVNDALQSIDVALSASESHLWLNQLDKSLNEKILEKFGILRWITLKSALHGLTSLCLQALNQFIDLLHSSDTLFVLLCTLGDLQVNFSDVEILLKLKIQLLSLGEHQLLLLDNKVSISLLLDLTDTLLTVSLNELDHAIHDLLRLQIIHL
jgi:hypothetical protein